MASVPNTYVIIGIAVFTGLCGAAASAAAWAWMTGCPWYYGAEMWLLGFCK